MNAMPNVVTRWFWEPIRSDAEVEPPFQSSPTFWRMKDMPTAVISGASFGAPRSGR